MRLLIAGCGDLGQRVAQGVLDHPADQVWGLRRHPVQNADPDRIHWVTADLLRPETLQNIAPDISHVLFAATPDARDEQGYRDLYLHGLQHLVQAVRSPVLERVVFISSTAVYGDHGDAWVDENTLAAPSGFNGRVMLEAEQWLEQSGLDSTGSMSTVSLRLSGIYGPGRTYLLDRLRRGMARAPAEGVHWANRIHIDDAAAAVVHILRMPCPQTLYLVTDDTPLPMRTLYEALARLAGGPVPALGPVPAAVSSKRLNNARLRATGLDLRWPDSRAGHAALILADDQPAAPQSGNQASG